MWKVQLCSLLWSDRENGDWMEQIADNNVICPGKLYNEYRRDDQSTIITSDAQTDIFRNKYTFFYQHIFRFDLSIAHCLGVTFFLDTEVH